MEETIKNLARAFIGESQARNRYGFYAKVAKKEGFMQIAEIFLLTAENEREHASTIFGFIQELKKRTGKKLDEIEARFAEVHHAADRGKRHQVPLFGQV